MRTHATRKSRKAGLPPGTPVYLGNAGADAVRITVIDYDETHLCERDVADATELAAFRDSPTVTWINVIGVHDVGAIETIGRIFGLHPLSQEDIVNTTQRPKLEDFDSYLYGVLRMLRRKPDSSEIDAEQVSLILGPGLVISFQEREGDVFDAVRERLRSAKGRIRKMGPDYLLYSLIDAIVDNYFVILEHVGERISATEDILLEKPTPNTLQEIHRYKSELIFLRRSVWPLRELISGLEKTESSLVARPTRLFVRDVYDHTIQVIDTLETYRDVVSGLFDIYLSSASNRMNEVMKVLTIIATIFIPLTFIAGIYGMNFTFMPELDMPWAYPATLGVMVGVALGMLVFFRRRGWI